MRGWNDEATERLAMRKGESGIPGRADIQTLFDYIDFGAKQNFSTSKLKPKSS